MLTPRNHTMGVLGLGRSVGTPPGGIEADAFVVSSFDDLKANASKAVGRIVVFNAPFVSYGETVMYRVSGASVAASYGAVAALVRSVTPLSLYTLHTGEMGYDSRYPAIPTASVTVEDAEMMARMQARGQHVRLHLKMDAYTAPDTKSRNVMAELVGSTYPDEIVLIGGHSDSWDVGQGAMDDGAGFFSGWEAVNILTALVSAGKIERPKRTIRCILWVDEGALPGA
jgi:carboxypeptidase Q